VVSRAGEDFRERLGLGKREKGILRSRDRRRTGRRGAGVLVLPAAAVTKRGFIDGAGRHMLTKPFSRQKRWAPVYLKTGMVGPVFVIKFNFRILPTG
jgi:hypothetical protein